MKEKEKKFYINIIKEDEVITKFATQKEIDQLKAAGEEVVVDETNVDEAINEIN